MKVVRSILVWALVGTGTAMIAAPVLTYATGALRQARLASEVRTLLGPENQSLDFEDQPSAEISSSSASRGDASPAPSAPSREPHTSGATDSNAPEANARPAS